MNIKIDVSKLSIILLLILTIGYCKLHAGSGVYQKGEELVYEVSFFGVKLGKIKIVSEGEMTLEGKKIYKSKAYMNSYDGIPFVDLVSVYESWMHQSLKYSHQFVSHTKLKDDTWDYQMISMGYPDNIVFEQWREKKKLKEVDIKTKKYLNDGSSLFFLSREMLMSGKSYKIPTILDTNVMYTYLNFHGRSEQAEIDLVDYPVNTIYFDGRAEWKGVYGLSGKFKGWFSNDEARVPIRAEMNVYLGNVVIELIEYKRENWQPPKWE